MTKEWIKCVKDACKEMKKMVGVNGPDGTPGLLNQWTETEFYNVIVMNKEEFDKEILEHPFFAGKDYKSIVEVAKKEYTLFLYCLQVFLNEKFATGLVIDKNIRDLDNTIPADPTETVIDATINTKKEYTSPECDVLKEDELKNKKEFIKEVLDGIEHKKTLKEFLSDPRSYRQFRDDVDRCLLHIDWEKIHRVMKKLKWKWTRWIDNEFNEHTNTVPSVFGIKDHVYDMIKRMEDWILEHGDDDRYLSGTGGFEYEMYICEEADIDDYDHRVRFAVRFVVEQFDNGL